MINLQYFVQFLGFVLIHAELTPTGPPLETVKQWNLLSYDLPWDFPAQDKEFFNPENIVATGIAITHDRIFVATPRLFSGVPATISSVPRNDIANSPVLQAYPDWTFHAAGRKEYNCNDIGLVSVYRMKIDSCNRLWALDAGVSRSLEDYEVTCPPKILVIDLNTNQVVRRIDFPREVIRGESLYTNMIIDETTSSPGNHCDDVFVYISDTVEPAIVVYDSGRDLTWRLIHPAMYPDPNFAQSTILGQRFTLLDGIVGLAFDEKAGNVYFQPLATDRLFSVSTSALRAGPLPFGAELPVKLVGKKSSQGIGLAISPLDGSIIFSPMSETAVALWNPNTNSQKILAYDQDQIQFVADITIPLTETNSIYMISSRFHRYFLKNLNPNEFNIRILRLENEPSGGNSATDLQHLNYVLPQSSIPPNSQPIVSIAPNNKAATFSGNYFNSIRQPYPYEPVGIVDKSISNPFRLLNTGEKPDSFVRNQLNNSPYQYYKPSNSLSELHALRIAKNINYNTTVHH